MEAVPHTSFIPIQRTLSSISSEQIFFLSYTRNCQLFQEWVLISSPLPRSSRALRKVLVLTSNKTASILTSGKALPSLTFGRVQLSKIIFCITLLTYNNF